MNQRVFVGNLPQDVISVDLRALIDGVGVRAMRVWICRDRATGRSRGFGFIELAPGSDLGPAVRALNGLEVRGQRLAAAVALPRAPT